MTNSLLSRLDPKAAKSAPCTAAAPPSSATTKKQTMKDFVFQFEKSLHLSSNSVRNTGFRKSLKPSTTSGSGSVVKRWRKKRSKVKKVVVLRPSKLQQPAVVQGISGNGPERHFSFEHCSKELESIEKQSKENVLRPRSSSLPSKKINYSHSNKINKTSNNTTTEIKTHKDEKKQRKRQTTCAQQAHLSQDIDRLTDYLEESILLPKKMSYMAEMMYT